MPNSCLLIAIMANRIFILIILAIGLTGCRGFVALYHGQASQTIEITKTEYDIAFAGALRTARAMDFVVQADKESGSIVGSRDRNSLTKGSNFFFSVDRATEKGKLTAIVKIQSAEGSTEVLNSFVAAYAKDVHISAKSDVTVTH